MGRRHAFGRDCENAAANFLVAHGWRIIARNFRSGHREIDLIATKANVVAFVEVKGRSETARGYPLEAIGYQKRIELARAARAWIAGHAEPGVVYRFDAVSVTRKGSALQVEHVEDAWRV
jgi:putative endonuclease